MSEIDQTPPEHPEGGKPPAPWAEVTTWPGVAGRALDSVTGSWPAVLRLSVLALALTGVVFAVVVGMVVASKFG